MADHQRAPALGFDLDPQPFSLRRWYHRLPLVEKISMVILAASTLAVAVLQLLASWEVAGGVKEQIKLTTNTTRCAEDIYVEVYEVAERLFILMNTLVPMTNRLLLMQLCADHPVSHVQFSNT